MEKDVFSPIFSTEGVTRHMNMWLPTGVPQLVVEKTGKATRGLSDIGTGRIACRTLKTFWHLQWNKTSMKQVQK